MNNLHRELAPISDVAWAAIEAEARRTFIRNLAGRRVVDLVGPAGPTRSAVGTGHVRRLEVASAGVIVQERQSQPVIELRAPFSVARQAVDDVERGAEDSDWQAVKDAATQNALAEDHTVFNGCAAAGIPGIVPYQAPTRALPLPADVRHLPDTIRAGAERACGWPGSTGPTACCCRRRPGPRSPRPPTTATFGTQANLARLLDDGEILSWRRRWTVACSSPPGGGDYQLHLGQELSIGYLSHDAEQIQLYLQESLSFLPLTAESGVPLTAA